MAEVGKKRHFPHFLHRVISYINSLHFRTIEKKKEKKLLMTHDLLRCHILAAYNIFTALHVMQTRYCDEISVRPSVRLSVCLSVRRVICDKIEERSVQIFIPYERTFSLVF